MSWSIENHYIRLYIYPISPPYLNRPLSCRTPAAWSRTNPTGRWSRGRRNGCVVARGLGKSQNVAEKPGKIHSSWWKLRKNVGKSGVEWWKRSEICCKIGEKHWKHVSRFGKSRKLCSKRWENLRNPWNLWCRCGNPKAKQDGEMSSTHLGKLFSNS